MSLMQQNETWLSNKKYSYLQLLNIFSILYKLIDFSYIDELNAYILSPTPISNT